MNGAVCDSYNVSSATFNAGRIVVSLMAIHSGEIGVGIAINLEGISGRYEYQPFVSSRL